MNGKYELTDEQLDALLMLHGKGDDGFRSYARAIIAADRALRASPAVGDVAAAPTFAQITAIRQAVDAEYEPILAKLQREHDSAMNERNHARHDQEDAQAALTAKDARIAKLESKLEVDPSHSYDGIDCRNATIKAQDEQIDALTAERDAALAASRYETDLCGQALADLKEMTAERDALLVAAKYAAHIDDTPENQLQTMLYDTLTERDALRKDAGRYRWLINNCGFGIRKNGVHELSVAFYEDQPDNIGDLDAAIDAAMTKEPT